MTSSLSVVDPKGNIFGRTIYLLSLIVIAWWRNPLSPPPTWSKGKNNPGLDKVKCITNYFSYEAPGLRDSFKLVLVVLLFLACFDISDVAENFTKLLQVGGRSEVMT